MRFGTENKKGDRFILPYIVSIPGMSGGKRPKENAKAGVFSESYAPLIAAARKICRSDRPVNACLFLIPTYRALPQRHGLRIRCNVYSFPGRPTGQFLF